MVSMKDISAACGVSVATVSKALNDHRDVGDETKQRIKQIAKEMGYFPNSSARALKTNKSYNIGVLFVEELPQSGLTHDYYATILDSFKVAVEAKGYDITFINCNRRKGRLSYLEHSKFRGVDGVLIACVDFEDPEVVELVNSDIPVVTIDYAFDNKLAVLSDNAKGIRDLVKYIYSQGHRRIAYIHGQNNNKNVTGRRLQSFLDTTKELGLEIPDEYIMEGKYRDTDNAAKNASILLNMKERPTCIIFSDDYSAIGGMNEIKLRGLNIPEDISIAGYDGSNIAAQIEPQLTTIVQDTRMIGRIAADNLINLIEKPKSTTLEHNVVEGMLRKGRSVRRIDDNRS